MNKLVEEYKVYIIIFGNWFQIAPTWKPVSEYLVCDKQSWFTVIHPGYWVVSSDSVKVFLVGARLGIYNQFSNKWWW